MGELCLKMQADLKLANFSQRTHDSYVAEARALARQFMKSPAELGREHVLDFLRAGQTPAVVRMRRAAVGFSSTE